MNECKLQLGCLVIVLFVVLIYYRQYFRYQLKYRFSLFDLLIITAVFSLVMDGVTAYTVNHLDTISHSFNLALHTLFLISLDTVVFVLFLYVLTATYSFPKKRITKIMILLPFSLNIVIVLFGIRSLKFIEGSISNYSMGLSAYTCFVMVGIYTLLTCIVFLKRWNYIGKSKKASIMIYLSIQISATLYQVFLPQALVTSIATTALILGIYLTQEDPAMRELSGYHHEMVMGFASSINLLQVFSFLITLFLMYILYFEPNHACCVIAFSIFFAVPYCFGAAFLLHYSYLKKGKTSQMRA